MPFSPVGQFMPRRIVLLRTCCIGDVVLATAALSALRAQFPQAQIHWAVGSWSAPAIAHHPQHDGLLLLRDDLPQRSPRALWRLVRQLRAGRYELAVSLSRSTWLAMATALARIPVRAGIDSGGRGFAYTVPVAIDPADELHEAQIYLKVVGALCGRELHAEANLPVDAGARASVRARLRAAGIGAPFIVAHPGGGSNPGTTLASKRYPPAQLAGILAALAAEYRAELLLIGGAGDATLVAAVADALPLPATALVGELSLPEVGALARQALVYIGNDSGLTHLAAASAARTVMFMGPTNPVRYAPFTADHLVLWQPAALPAGGARSAGNRAWDWRRDGIEPEAALEQIRAYMARARQR